MDILFVAEAILYTDIAYRLRVMKLMREASRRARVSLFIFGVAPPEMVREVDGEISSRGIPILGRVCLPPLPGMRLVELPLVMLASGIYLGYRLLADRSHGIVQAENLLTAMLLLPFGHFPRRFAIVLDCHGAVPEEVRLKRPGLSRLLYPVLKFLERRCIALADGLVLPSEGFRDHVSGSFEPGRKQVVVLPNRIERSRFGTASGERRTVREELGLEDRFVIVYSGNAAPYQEPRLMAESFRRVHLADERAFFLCFSSAVEIFSELLHEARLPASSYRVMRVDHSDVPRYLQAGDLALMLRRDSTVNRVSFPTKFGEYLACGVPVLTTPWAGDCSALVEDLGVGIVVPELGAGSVAGAVTEYMRRHPEECEGLREHCRKTALEVLMPGDEGGVLDPFYEGLDRGRSDG